MQTLVAGVGAVGSRIAVHLSQRGERVIAIDQDKTRCEWLSKNSDAEVYHGNVLNTEVLLQTRIEKADAMVVALNNDAITTKLVTLGKSQFGVPRVLAVARSLENKNLIKQSGADKVVCSEEVVLNEVESLLQMKGHRTLYFDRDEKFKILKVVVRATSQALGKNLAFATSKGARVAAIIRGGKLLFPSDDTEFEMGDELFVMGSVDAVDRVELNIEGV